MKVWERAFRWRFGESLTVMHALCGEVGGWFLETKEMDDEAYIFTVGWVNHFE